MNRDPLRALTVLAETGSLAATAVQLHLTPAAVHKQLKQIENEYGVRLYEKAGRGLRLSAAAHVLLPYARSAIAQVEASRKAIEEWRGLRRGLVRLGTGPTLSSHWLPALLQGFRRRYPQIQMTVETGSSNELLTSARQGSLDLAVLVAPSQQVEPGFEILARWRFGLTMVTGDAQIPMPVGIEDLVRLPFIGFRKGSRIDALIEQTFSRHGIEPDTIMRFDNADAIRSILRAGIGYSLLPTWTLGEDIRAGALWRLETMLKPPAAWVEMVRHESVPLSPAAREFIAMARSKLLE